jgi:hypothetical protein
MSRMLLFIYHIAFCILCNALVNYGHLLHVRVDHMKSKSEFQTEQVQWVFGDPQASSCENANIIMIKTSSGVFNHASCLLI